MMKSSRFLGSIALGLMFMVPVSVHSAPKSAVAATDKQEQKVVFNTKTLKYHGASCKWAKKCTVNCVVLPLSEAIRRGGVPCKVCGGR